MWVLTAITVHCREVSFKLKLFLLALKRLVYLQPSGGDKDLGVEVQRRRAMKLCHGKICPGV